MMVGVGLWMDGHTNEQMKVFLGSTGIFPILLDAPLAETTPPFLQELQVSLLQTSPGLSSHPRFPSSPFLAPVTVLN